MELDAKTLYQVTFEQLMQAERAMLEYKALYIETKNELDELKSNLNISE